MSWINGIKKVIRTVLTEYYNKRYQKELMQKKGNYPEWTAGKEREKTLFDLSGKVEKTVYLFRDENEGEALDGLDDVCENFFADHPEVLIAYGDEDFLSVDGRCNPWFKPAWSPDLYACSFYFGSVTAVRRGFYESFSEELKDLTMPEKVDFLVQKAGGYHKGCRSIGPIHEVLFHHTKEGWEKPFLPGKTRFFDMSFHTYRECLNLGTGAIGAKEEVSSRISTKISVVIPSKDHPQLLADCIGSICRSMESIEKLQLIVVDNGSSKENCEKIRAFLNDIRKDGIDTCYLYEQEPFNFSHMCNLGAEAADGELLLFLNDDVELAVPDTLKRMSLSAGREYTGAVGIKLYYPDTTRIQHAGISNLPMGPVHKLQFLEDRENHYFGANRGQRNFLAVTAACLMIEKKKYQEVGGFCEELAVAFNDVDFCFHLWEAGYYNMCDEEIFAYHHESVSRGDDETAEKLERLWTERDHLYERHPALEGKDPFYPPGLAQDVLDSMFRPSYETNRNFWQTAVNFLRRNLAGYRYDACLHLRIEWCRDRRILGYAVVLGDDNACYEKELLLRNMDDENAVYAIKLKGQYRPDLSENMKDQVNVALCGFQVELAEGIGEGTCFVIGAAAANRTNATKLYCWSNRRIRL